MNYSNVRLVIIALAFALSWWHSAISPFTLLPGDRVEPTKVMPQGAVSVYRNYSVRGEQQVLVIRTMVKGDCTVSCEILPLINEEAVFSGTRRDAQKSYIIPSRATPGIWRLAFSLVTKDMLGRPVITNLPELEIEVLP